MCAINKSISLDDVITLVCNCFENDNRYAIYWEMNPLKHLKYGHEIYCGFNYEGDERIETDKYLDKFYEYSEHSTWEPGHYEERVLKLDDFKERDAIKFLLEFIEHYFIK